MLKIGIFVIRYKELYGILKYVYIKVIYSL